MYMLYIHCKHVHNLPVPGVNDSQEFQNMLEAMNIMGMTDEEWSGKKEQVKKERSEGGSNREGVGEREKEREGLIDKNDPLDRNL